MRRAALISGGVVLALFGAVGLWIVLVTATSDVVYPDMSWLARTRRGLAGFVAVVLTGVPFALIATWRASVHARDDRSSAVRGWRGVAEAALLGVAVAVPFVAPAIRNLPTRPFLTLLYMLAYALLAAVIGAAVGLLVRVVTLLAIKR